MENKAENIVKNVGAMAETTAIFYNNISKWVSKDVALALTQHFMELTMNRRSMTSAVVDDIIAAINKVQALEAKRKEMEKKQAEAKEKKPEETKPEEEA